MNKLMHQITGTTKLFGVIAYPADHVRAPEIFNPFFVEKGIDAVMVPLAIRPSNLGNSIRKLALMPNFGGVCVTIPHKQRIVKLCDSLEQTAKITRAVNVVRFEDGRIIGANFDGKGFVAGLAREKIDLKGMKVLMLGAGGAARGVAVALAESGAQSLTIANRGRYKPHRIKFIMREHFPNFPFETISLDATDRIISKVDLIINATSLGLRNRDSLPCSLKEALPKTIVADIIMTPPVTAWMEEAEALGLQTHAGIHMLTSQRDLIADFLRMKT